jgi:hypothetical protein
VVVLPDRVSGDQSVQYQNMTTEYKPLDWNWDELMTLLDSYCQSSTSSGSGSGSVDNSTGTNMTDGNMTDMNTTTPVVGDSGSGNDTAPAPTDTNAANSTELVDNWQNLDIAWTDLLANATSNPDMTTWDKATY